ncbi:MAG: hypothetical protein IPM48_06750 [Saprospiraceae bacterium]|nr:hypothetical protein [Saprospiraceae bacterium]
MNNQTYNKKCWLCGEIANSEEHKFKASILKRHFGKNYSKNKHTYISGKEEKTIDSYKSKELKFPPIICEDCNNNKTRSADVSYDLTWYQ